MSKKLVSLFLVLLLAFGAAASSAEGAGIVVTDMMGREITLSEPATRIVVMQPSDCEILCAIGCEEAIVGRGQYVDYPASILEVPVVQSGAETNVEEILALQPQVVLMNSMSQSEEQVKQLEENGVQVVVSTTSNIESVYTAIQLIGKLMGKDTEAEAVIADMQATFDEIKAKVSGETKKVYFEISPPPYLYTAGSSSYMNELAEICGITNIFADQEDAWLMISEEQVIERDPDYIVLITNMGSAGVEEILSREGWSDISAIKNRKVFNDEDSCMARPSPRLKDAAIELYNFVYEIEAEEKPAA
uniref:ABC transporter substrate-binding protein n=1 Tax=uncultured bacterium Contig13 TaxID=1393410 RepID=W0FNS2_9BACT|nr:ABC transporter substrate-binding protein [uncultured bacterium Contig13]